MEKTNYLELRSQKDRLLSDIREQLQSAKDWEDILTAMFPPLINFMSLMLDVIEKNEVRIEKSEV